MTLQSKYPEEILIIDGSKDTETEEALQKGEYKNLKYYKVPAAHRGLTKQRNYGIARVSTEIDVVCYFDDDVILDRNYLEKINETYLDYPDALGVGGYITNQAQWEKVEKSTPTNSNYFYYDGYRRKEGSRFKLRRKLGLDADVAPGFLPTFSHGRSIGFLPPSGRIYNVEQLIGCMFSFKKEVFERCEFSEYFDGYGLYEDADFSFRVAALGKLYTQTAARLEHHHNPSGRPNTYVYGKMVVRNGWYVWRVRHPKPNLKARLKWNLTSGLLTLIRFSNVLTTSKRKAAFTEALGRTVGWWSLLISKPQKQ
jgi:GT2 family glycosyltransferase